MLEALGLEIIIPANGESTCLSGKGSVIDYIVCTKGWGHLVQSCEVVRSVPCGTHVGVRTTFVPNAEDVVVTSLRKPKTLDAAVAYFTAKSMVDPHYQIPSWEVACGRTEAAARQHVLDHRVPKVDDYVQQLGIEEECVTAAIKYARWSAAAEYRLLASKGINVGASAWQTWSLS